MSQGQGDWEEAQGDQGSLEEANSAPSVFSERLPCAKLHIHVLSRLPTYTPLRKVLP